MEAEFAGRVVLVTGGTSGVGAGCAAAFVEAGATVVIAARDASAGERRAASLNAMGPGSCAYRQSDIADAAAIKALVDGVVHDFGRLDCLVNNAGRSMGWRRIDAIAIEEFEALLRTNVVSYFAASKFALPHLRAVRGSIVNIGSIVAETGSYRSADYTATKGAISALTRSLAIDEAAAGVRVNAVLPGNVLTERWTDHIASVPYGGALSEFVEDWSWLGRSADPEEIGRVVVFLASPAASYITGATIMASGGAELGAGRHVPYEAAVAGLPPTDAEPAAADAGGPTA